MKPPEGTYIVTRVDGRDCYAETWDPRNSSLPMLAFRWPIPLLADWKVGTVLTARIVHPGEMVVEESGR